MASKGPKTGSPTAVSKPVARPKKTVAPVAAFEPEKILPVAAAEPVVPFVTEPAEVLEAAPQVTESVAEAAQAPIAAQAAVAAAAPEFVTDTVAAAQGAAPAKGNSIMDTIENNTAKAQAFFGDFNDRAKAAVEKSTKLVEDANEFAKGNVEAMVESGRIAAKGLETFGQDAAEYGRRSFESATAAMKSLAAVKSPTEFFKLQSDYFRTAFDSYVAEASKNTEAMIKLAGDAAQPLSNRVAVAVEKAKVAA
jgi:phasin family protein